jgi:ribosomal protein S18 acetylase RimI-like enzyme
VYECVWVKAGLDSGVAEVVRLIEIVSADEPFVGLPTNPTAEASAALQAKLVAGITSGQTQLLTVRAESGEVAGCVAISRPATANQRHIGELTTGAVHPGHRGGPVVTMAFREVVRRCEEIGIELLRLDVRAGIRAETLWRSYGFGEYGRLDDYGRIGAESYSGVYLAQPVKQLKTRLFDKEVSRAQQG